MIIDLHQENLDIIRNPDFRAYATIYTDIYKDFMGQITSTGVEVDTQDDSQDVDDQKQHLLKNGAIIGNRGNSVYLNQISTGCVACRKGIGSATFFVSLECHRDCFYCFNPNQEDYDFFQDNSRDLITELDQIKQEGLVLKHIAITGGEPLLHKDEVIAFFHHARKLFPEAYQRLYTCGDYVTEEILEELKATGLDEIRFSIRMHDLEKGHWHTLERIALAKNYIENVMVEMPVLPGTYEIMKDVLLELERIGIFSINLLEFCYPFINAQTFAQKGYQVKKHPFKVLHNYWYAGGVPIARSEALCLKLIEFAIEHDFKMGVHYCSLENKLTGQIYQQNAGRSLPATAHFSTKDYFVKSAKVYGDDIPKVLKVFRGIDYDGYEQNADYNFLEFHLEQVEQLKDLDIEIGVSYNIWETRDDGDYLRELKVDLAYPEDFVYDRDI